MNVLFIDHCGNALELAAKYASQRQSDEIFVISDYACPYIWKGLGVTVFNKVHKFDSLQELTAQHAISLVVNFSPSWGKSGFLVKLEQQGIACVGTHKSFALTETNKTEFKLKCVDAGISVPLIKFRGTLNDIFSNIEKMVFPLVIKPDIQLGAFTKVIQNIETLTHYAKNISSQYSIAKTGLPFLIEEYIAFKYELNVQYWIINGVPIIERYSAFLPTEKTMTNPIGGAHAANGYFLAQKFRATFSAVLKLLSDSVDENCYGFFQVGIDQNDQAYLFENNARPPGCCPYSHWQQPFELIDTLVTGDHLALQHVLALTNQSTPFFGAVCFHKQRKLVFSEDVVTKLLAIDGFNPVGIHKVGEGYESRHSWMPSSYIAYGSTPAEALAKYKRDSSIIADIAGYMITPIPDALRAI